MTTQNVMLANGTMGVINTVYDPTRMALERYKLTESQSMGMKDLDILYSTGGSPNAVGMYLDNIKKNWDDNLRDAKFEPSPYMTEKFNEYYDRVKLATHSCSDTTFLHDVNSSQLIKYLTLKAREVVMSTFIVGLNNDYRKTADNVRMYNIEQAATAIYLSSNQVFEKIEQGRFNELTVEDMNKMKSIVPMTNQRLENQMLLLFFGDMLSYVNMHYAAVMQTLQNLAHMPTENGTGLLAALEKCLHLDTNKALLYKAQMGEYMMEFNQEHPEYAVNSPDGQDTQLIESKASAYRYAGMPFEQAWQRATQEVAAERNKAITDEMSKHHNKFITQHRIVNPEMIGIPTEYNTQAIGIQPISPGMGPVKLGLPAAAPAAPVQNMYGYQAPPMYAAPPMYQPAYQQAQQSTGYQPSPYHQPVNRNAPLFPNGVPSVNDMQAGQQVYNNGGQYVPVQSQPQNNGGLVNINGVWCKETSPGSGTFVAVNNAPTVPKNSFDVMYPNGFM